MARIVAFLSCVAIVIAQGLPTNTLAQVPNSGNSQTTGIEPTTAVKKNEPNWQSMLDEDNRSYLANIHRTRQELERFKQNPLWTDALTQMLGSEYLR